MSLGDQATDSGQQRLFNSVCESNGRAARLTHEEERAYLRYVLLGGVSDVLARCMEQLHLQGDVVHGEGHFLLAVVQLACELHLGVVDFRCVIQLVVVHRQGRLDLLPVKPTCFFELLLVLPERYNTLSLRCIGLDWIVLDNVSS